MNPRLLAPCVVCILAISLTAIGCDKSRSGASATSSQDNSATSKTTPPTRTTLVLDIPIKYVDEEEPVTLGPGTPEQQDMLVKAKVLYLNGRAEEAEPIFKKLAESEPVSSPQVSGAIALGDIYTTTERASMALPVYEKLLERVGDLPEVYLVVGRAYASQSQTDRAIAAFEKTLELSPTYIFLHVELGQLYEQKGDTAKSTAALLEYEKQIYAIAKALTEPEKTALKERLHLIDVVSFVEDDKVTETLLTVATSDPDFEARAAASRALGDVRAVSARPTLEKIASGDGSDEVREAAKKALEAMSDIPEPGKGDVTAPTFVDDPEKLGEP